MGLDQFIQIRRDLHQIPELGFNEIKTQKYVLDYVQSLPQDHLEVKTWRTGILVKITGRNPSKTIAYRTDMDGLPIVEQTTYSFKSKHEGHMHACGHDLHMAIALGVLTHFAGDPVDDHLLFIFQPAEEGPGGAKPMLKSAEFQAWKPDMIMALHIAPEYPVGTIATKEGLLFANTSELFIDFKGRGGHAAFPHLTQDMVVAASHFVTQLQTIISRNIDPLDSAVVTIGKISGGTKQNIIAETSRLEGTIRTLSLEAMHHVKSRIEALLKGLEIGFECTSIIDYGANYCQVFNDESLTREFMNWVKENNAEWETPIQLIECKHAMTGEDFGYFIEEIPGFMFWLGVDTPYGLHHAQIEPNEKGIKGAIGTIIQYLTFQGINS